ncbi:MAG TPA: universal stress protein [Nitrosopumilaceae archaeon]|nr:universal stress protein [Nitrosopumilaceae archaeon]
METIYNKPSRGNFDKVLLSSVSNSIMQKAKCPVLIIK